MWENSEHCLTWFSHISTKSPWESCIAMRCVDARYCISTSIFLHNSSSVLCFQTGTHPDTRSWRCGWIFRSASSVLVSRAVWSSIPWKLHQSFIFCAMNSGPLSTLIFSGFPRHSISSSRPEITFAEGKLESMLTCRISRLKSSIMFRLRTFLPHSNVSCIKPNEVVRRSQIHAPSHVWVNRPQ